MTAIAVVGMACRYADAASPRELWENVMAGRRAFRRIPRERLDLADYHSADADAPDMTYATEAAVLEGWEFDRVGFRVPGGTYRAVDMTHWLALEVAASALADGGFADGAGLPRDTTGVLLGNTLAGEFSRAATMRLRWPYVRRNVEAQLVVEGWDAARREIFLAALERTYKEPFAAVGEESLAGGLSNTIAGRICGHYQLRGGGFTVDGACSSSLLAVAHACAALKAGDLDVALAGGVDLSLDPFELVGFAKTGALARGAMRVYDRDSAGFLPGEGCGVLVLMRHDDALADARTVHALIRGWGVSSDGGGGITRPEEGGQRLAIERAYRRAGYGIDSVALFEGHGTGTAVGDEVELRALGAARRANGAQRPAALGSIKANIGHTKAAAGAAGLIKAVCALRAQILPPATGMRHAHALLDNDAAGLRLLTTAETWPADQPLRAGVSAFGFGGINVHVTLEGVAAQRRAGLAAHDRMLLAGRQDSELFTFAAVNAALLLAQVERALALAAQLAHAELADLAAGLAASVATAGAQPWRAALLAASPAELAARLEILHRWLVAGETRAIGDSVFLGHGASQPRIVFLFPGQAAPVRLDGGLWQRRFPEVADLYARAALAGGATDATDVAQPAIVAAELAALRVLRRFGIDGAAAVGHSLGELAALRWADACDDDGLLRLAAARGRLMACTPEGAMASIEAAPAEIASWLADGAVVAAINGPRASVVAGTGPAIEQVVRTARSHGRAATRLPVARAFHSPLMAGAGHGFADYLDGMAFRPLARRVISTVTGAALEVDADLRSLLRQQLTAPVRFADAAVAALQDADLGLELGPGQILTGLAGALTQVPVIAVDACGPGLAGLLQALGAAYALGAPVDLAALFADRFTRPLSLDKHFRFLASPCESAPPRTAAALPLPLQVAATGVAPGLTAGQDGAPVAAPASGNSAVPQVTGAKDVIEVVRRLVADKTELPIGAIADDARLLADLHLNSISIGQLVAAASRQLGLAPPVAPTDYASATLAGVAQALFESLQTGGQATVAEGAPQGVDDWVRAFVVEWVATPAPPLALPAETAAGAWIVLADAAHPLAEPLAAQLRASGRSGVAVCLSATPSVVDARRLLQAARQSIAAQTPLLVVHAGGGAALAKTLHLESGLPVYAIEVPMDPAAAAWAAAETRSGRGFVEARFDADGRRFEPRLAHLPLGEGGAIPLLATDVLLVSGGGKGIAAECALALALRTGVRLVLLGRSLPERDGELAANLARLAGAGVAVLYYAADVTDGAAVADAVARAEAEFGPVTALLHGAGVNQPQLLGMLDDDDLAATLAVKVDGLRNLLAALDADRLKVLLCFSSIIGVSGMRGEADYALANEWLSGLTRDFALAHPPCRTLAAEWSIWSGVGMGERLGRVDALRREGITPIAADAGIDMLMRLLGQALPSASLVISGRLGDSPTLRIERGELPFLRFLERTRVWYPGIELVVEATLTTASDPYLADHEFRGDRLLPAVIGMDAMAQVAMALAADDRAPSFEAIEFLRPLVITEQPVTLRVAALLRQSGAVDVVLRSSDTGFHVDHFRARCRFDQVLQPRHQLLPTGDAQLAPEHLYGGLLFQSGRLRRILGYRELAARHCCAAIEQRDDTWFGRYLPGRLVLGDAGARDAMLHAIQACVPHGVLLPVAVEHWQRVAAPTPGPLVIRARERWQRGQDYSYDVEAFSADGMIQELWGGLLLRRVAVNELPQMPAALLAPYLERRLAELIPGSQVAVAIEQGPVREERADLALSRLTGRAIVRRPDGRPEAAPDRVSAAHAGELTLAVASSSGVACDIEAVLPRDAATWHDLLGGAHLALARRQALEAGEDEARAATRVWGALECLKKVGASPACPLVLERCLADGWCIFTAGDLAIASRVIEVVGSAVPLAITVLTATERTVQCPPPTNIVMS